MNDCEDGSMRSWSELPITALTLTFEKLDLPHRAGTPNCVACVCSSWAEAAAAATRSINLDKLICSPDRSADTDSLQEWLHSRGANVRELRLKAFGGVITSLPCPKLEHLVLECVHVDLRPGSQLVQDLCAATALTTLSLNYVVFEGYPDLAAVLARLPVIQDLCLLDTRVGSALSETLHASTALSLQDSPPSPEQVWLAQKVGDHKPASFTDAGMQLLCTLTSMRELELQSMEAVTAAGLAALQNLRELNSLELDDLACDFSLTAVPALSKLTALTSMQLSWLDREGHYADHEFDSLVLTHVTQLKDLGLYCCTAPRGAAGAAELLSRLSQMPVLETLQLIHVRGLNKVPPAAFSQLASSSALRSLTWHDIR